MKVDQPCAACVLIERDDKVLAVARRGSTTEFGLPGGKIDPGEEALDAAVREAAEETGLHLDKGKLVKIFERSDGSYLTTTFKYYGEIDVPEQGDAGIVKWVSWDTLKNGPFKEYNTALKVTVHGR
jgi:8-oxo-dGTP pyrophosphatase MutT (NUDIX family)